jgi:hypothetical protein
LVLFHVSKTWTVLGESVALPWYLVAMATIGTCPLIQKTHTKTILHAGFLRKALPGSHLNRLRAHLLTKGALALPRAASSPHPNLARLEKGPADS